MDVKRERVNEAERRGRREGKPVETVELLRVRL
jgi:hypothetical protein